MESLKGKQLMTDAVSGVQEGCLAAGGHFEGSSSNINAEKSVAVPEGGNIVTSGRKNKEAPSNAAQMDPKKLKRLVANREAGKRCRMKKFGYVVDLEHKSFLLQESLKIQRPRLQYFDRYIKLMKTENSELRAQIDNISQTNTIREAELALLTKERLALKQLFEMQIQKGNEYIQMQQHQAEQFIMPEPYAPDLGIELANIINMDDFSYDQIRL